MFLSETSIRRPVLTATVTAALMALGILGAGSLGVDLFPDVSVPVVTVTTSYPGAGPEEVEQLVTRPIEDRIAAVNGLDEVRSYSRDSVSTVVVRFRLDADRRAAAADIRDKVAAVRADLPRDVGEPVVQRVDPAALPILAYALSSPRDPAETRRLAEDVVRPGLEAVEGVDSVRVLGGLEREIHVFLDRGGLEALGLSLSGLAQQLGGEGSDLPAGRVTSGRTELDVKTLGRFRSLDELRATVVATSPTGAQVRLSDVARVEEGYKESRVRSRLDGQDVVVLEIRKRGGSNTVRIADGVEQAIARSREVLPRDVKILRAVDASAYVRRNVSDAAGAIVLGGAMAVLVVLLFLLDWRSTLVSALALPVSAATALLASWWMGFTFNAVTLLALSLVVGLPIADAALVRESICRRTERGDDPFAAARRGAAEIAPAAMAAAIAIAAAFAPAAFMGGIAGRFLGQFGLTAASVLLVSFLVSRTLVPVLSARAVKPVLPGDRLRLGAGRLAGPIVRFQDRLEGAYRGLIGWALRHRGKVALAALALFAASLALTRVMGTAFMTPEDRGDFVVSLEMPAGISIDEMDRVTRRAEGLLRRSGWIRRLYTVVGAGEEANRSSLRVQVAPRRERQLSQWDIQEELRQRLAEVPALKYGFADVDDMEGTAHELPLTLYVRGEDYGRIQEGAQAALEVVKGVRGVKDADQSFRAGRPETDIRVDRPRAADLGVSVGTVAQTARLALEGEVIARYRQGERDCDVRLQLAPEDRTSLATVRELLLPATGRRLGAAAGAGQRLVRLADLADVVPGSGPATIERLDRQRQIVVAANVEGRSLGEALQDVQAGLARLDRPGIHFALGAHARHMAESFRIALLALLGAVVLIYLVLASRFESFAHPLAVMAALPLAIAGALVPLFLTGQPISMAAAIGVILLMGLATRNAILLVDRTNELRVQGKGMIEALLEAGPARLRPILMTSAAMVLGMLPATMTRSEGSEFRAPIAHAVVGGVVVSTLLALLVVPVVYSFMDGLTLKRRPAATRDPLREAAEGGIGSETPRAASHPKEDA